MHNAAFSANGCAHVYGVCETDDVNVVLEELAKPGAGGGSVTIPLKEQLMTHVPNLSPSAKAIGSLNTLTVQSDGSLYAGEFADDRRRAEDPNSDKRILNRRELEDHRRAPGDGPDGSRRRD